MKINLELTPADVKELFKLFTQPAPLPTISDFQTTEKEYFAEVSKFVAPVTPTFEDVSNVKDKSNGKEHQSLAERIKAAEELLPGN